MFYQNISEAAKLRCKMNVEIPQVNMYAGVMGVRGILEVLTQVSDRHEPVTLSFSNCHFISAEGIALIAGMKLLRDIKGFLTEIDINSIEHRVKLLLSRSQLLGLFGSEPSPLGVGNTLPIYTQSELCKDGILHYIDNEVLRRTQMPKMSEDLLKEVRRAFFEVFGNIFCHSQSPIGGIVCGQVYPNSKEIQIVFYDIGVGIAGRIREVQRSINSDTEAIEWALRMGTSTLSNSGESRGLGLFLLRQFLFVNGGILNIYANKGAVTEIKSKRICSILPRNLRETLIDMRIMIRNDVKYIFSYEE